MRDSTATVGVIITLIVAMLVMLLHIEARVQRIQPIKVSVDCDNWYVARCAKV